MHHHRFRIGRGTMKNETRDLKNGYRKKRSDQGICRSERQPERKTPFVGTGIAIETHVRFPCLPASFREREFYFGAFCLAHNRGDVAGADNSVSIASITASVEIWFIGNRDCLGTNSVKGDLDVPWKINAGLSRGRQ